MKIKTKYVKRFIVISAVLTILISAHVAIPLFRNVTALDGPSFVLESVSNEIPAGGSGNGKVWHRINRAYFKLSTPKDRDIWVSTEMTVNSSNSTRVYLFPTYAGQLGPGNTVFGYGEGSSTSGVVQICLYGSSPCSSAGVVYQGEWAKIPKNSHYRYILNTRTELMQNNKTGQYKLTYKKIRWKENVPNAPVYTYALENIVTGWYTLSK